MSKISLSVIGKVSVLFLFLTSQPALLVNDMENILGFRVFNCSKLNQDILVESVNFKLIRFPSSILTDWHLSRINWNDIIDQAPCFESTLVWVRGLLEPRLVLHAIVCHTGMLVVRATFILPGFIRVASRKILFVSSSIPGLGFMLLRMRALWAMVKEKTFQAARHNGSHARDEYDRLGMHSPKTLDDTPSDTVFIPPESCPAQHQWASARA